MFDLKKLVLSVSFALCLSAGAVHATVSNMTNTTDGNGLDKLNTLCHTSLHGRSREQVAARSSIIYLFQNLSDFNP